MTRSLLNHHSVRQALAIGLGVFAVALVFGLLIYAGGGNSASAGNAPPPDDRLALTQPGGDNTKATNTPVPELHATPIACPDTTDNPQKTAEVVSEGRHAVFEVYWSSATVNLTSNPCPPSVIHLEGTATPAPTPTPDPDATATPTPTPTPTGGSLLPPPPGVPATPTPTPVVVKYTIRSASNINLDTTVLHVPETVKQTRPADDATNSEDSTYRQKYGFLYEDADDDDATRKTAIAGTDEFWALPYCDPDYNEFEWQSGDMCMGFSTALLHEHHFLDGPNGKPPGKIYWEFESKREPGVDFNDKGVVYLFLPRDLEGVTSPDEQLTWSSLRIDSNVLEMDPETYAHRQWGFTKPGTYELSVHARGYPESALGTGSAVSVSSVPRIYTFHVGLLADLGLTASVSNSSPDPGDTIIYTIKASSKGPDKAENTKVKVALPAGLTYSSAIVSTGTYDSATGVWDVGDMDKPAAGETATTETLTLTVTVPTYATRGTALDTVVEIYATEDIGQTSHVRELDPHTHDNKKTISVTPASDDNVNPYFYIIREIAENSKGGTNVGGPIGLKDADGDTLTYALTGTGKDNFTVSKVTGGLQLAVASGVDLNYEDTASYDLRLTVSDHKDAYGNPDTKTDDSIPVRINVIDDTSETLEVTLSATPTTQTPNEEVAFTITIDDNPGSTQLTSYTLSARNVPGTSTQGLDPQTTYPTSQAFTGTYGYEARRIYSLVVTTADSKGNTYGPATATVTVIWDNDVD